MTLNKTLNRTDLDSRMCAHKFNGRNSDVRVLEVARDLLGITHREDVLDRALTRLHQIYPGALFAFLEEVRPGPYCRATSHYVGDEILSRASRTMFSHDTQLLGTKERVSPVLGNPSSSHRIGGLALCVWESSGGLAPDHDTTRELTQVVATAWRSAGEFEELRAQTSQDELTNVLNRKGILEVLHREQARSDRYNCPLSVLFVDLDHFKKINDQHGHVAGDAALIAVAQRIQSCLRQTDAVGRFGGDEFLVVLPDTRLKAARHVARRIERAVHDAQLDLGNVQLHLGVTIGASALGEGKCTQVDIIDLADRRMLAAKRDGRTRPTLAAPEKRTASIQ